MARIPDEEIERLKKEIPIERMVTGFGVELKRQGKDLFGRCPFPDDRTLSQQRRRLYFVVMKTRGVSRWGSIAASLGMRS
jgi:hypothetical protein